MIHEMRLNPGPFKNIYDGIKTIELRLYDEKRRKVAVGDEIVFVRTEKSQFRMRAEVIALHIFPSFKELFETLPLTKCGYTEENVSNASPKDMLKYYSEEEEAEYGVVGIEIKLIEKPFRDIYRFEPFLAEMSELWQRVPDWRFGQMIVCFQHWLEYNKHGDGFYFEDEKYIDLFRQFMDSLKQ